MAANPDNLDPKEATEAKLCAYLEGELSPSDRIEIEQHLAANPQHRQLLVELARTRDWMRAIPRETSPIDLGEVFQGQVERAMLLDESGDNSPGMSLNRWPQYVLVAAITVLTLGLGVVLVAILKNPGPGSSGTVAIQNKNPAPLSSRAMASTTSPSSLDAEAAKPRSDHPVSDFAAPGIPQPLAVATPLTAAQDETDRRAVAKAMSRRPDEKSEADELRTRLLAAGVRVPSDQKTVCFVVSADTPATAVEQVRGFFDRHQIAFDAAPTEKFPYTQDRGGGVAFGNARNSENGGGGRQLAAAPRASAGAVEGQPGGSSVNRQQNQFVQNQTPDAANNNAVTNSANNTADKDKVSLVTTPGFPAASPAGETFYLAHGVSPLEVELLNASLLSDDNLKQTVQRITLSTGQVEETLKQPGTIAKGEILTVTIPQLVGPGIEKTNVVKVADDGTISLPMIDPLPATGAMPAELQQRIADKYREANLIQGATVTVAVAVPATSQPAVAAAPAATQPLKEKEGIAMAPPTTMQVGMQAGMPAAAAHSTPSTHPADASLVDVIVVVQPSKYPVPAAVPAPGK